MSDGTALSLLAQAPLKGEAVSARLPLPAQRWTHVAFSLGAGTNVVIIPSAGVGIVVLTNAAPTGAPEALAACVSRAPAPRGHAESHARFWLHSPKVTTT